MATFTLHARHHAERQQAARTQARIAQETGTTETQPGARAPGDKLKLRGIPVVGVKGGYGGAIPNTKPGAIREPCLQFA